MQTSVRVDDVFYKEAKEVFNSFGLSFGDAVNLYLAKVSMEKRIPFELSLPSEELEQRAKNIKNNNFKQFKFFKFNHKNNFCLKLFLKKLKIKRTNFQLDFFDEDIICVVFLKLA
jgi:DNA-damage-inducible protein J